MAENEQINVEAILSNGGFYEFAYSGETFTYTSGDSHLDGALPQFVNGENTLREEGRGTETVVTASFASGVPIP